MDVGRFAEHASVAAFFTTRDGVIRYCNQSYASLLGRAPHDVVGRTNAELFGDERARAFQARNEQILSSGKGLDSIEEFRAADGSVRTYFVNLFPLPAHDAVGGVIMDVTERLVGRDTFARQEETLKAVLASVNNGVWLVDAEWKTTYVNAAMAKLLGRAPDELVGRRPTDFIAPRHAGELEHRMRERERGDSITAGETVFLRGDGTEVITLHSASPLRDEQGRFAGAVAVMMDITESRQLEHHTREAQKLEALGVLAGGIAHDFNNLLTGVLGNVSGLRDEVSSPTGREGLDLIETAARRAAELCRQMLAFSGRGHFIVKPLALSAEVSAALELVRASLDKRHVLNTELDADVPFISADATQLAQVLLSLVMNATEAIGPRPGRITVRASKVIADERMLRATYLAPELPAGPYAVLEIIDDGDGMSDESKARLFEPFFSTKATGRGLGLAAVLGVVRGHRGAVEVVSARGRGTTVRVFFPAVEGVDVANPRSPSPPPTRVGEAKTVLVVDDEALVRSTLRRLLVRGGYQVLEAVDGQDCLDALSRGALPDLVLLDLSMPRLDGAATLEALRKTKPALPVVLMSGYSEQELAAQLVDKTATQFIQKPFSSGELLRCLKSALDGATVRI